MLYIMRHGKTDWNAVHRLQGSEDIPLNEEGRQMARDARKKYGDLRFDICYCSPLQRAQETAEIFLEGSGTPILTDDRLREMGFGMYEGTEHVTQKPECPVYTLFHDPVHYHAVDGAESLEHLYARSGSFIHDVLTPEVVSGKNVLIVAHGDFLHCLDKLFRGRHRIHQAIKCSNNGTFLLLSHHFQGIDTF